LSFFQSELKDAAVLGFGGILVMFNWENRVGSEDGDWVAVKMFEGGLEGQVTGVLSPELSFEIEAEFDEFPSLLPLKSNRNLFSWLPTILTGIGRSGR
jgi:hypothetical protein